MGIILSNDPDHTRNLFDVMYGARKPVTPEKNFMVSVLCALCVDTGTGQPCNPGDTRQIISSPVDWPSGNMARITPDFTAQVRNPGGSRPEESGIAEQHDAGWWNAATV